MARNTDTVTLADGRVVPIRQLGWLQLRTSRQLAQQASARGLIAMGGAEFIQQFQALRAAEPAAVDAAVSDPLASHDLLTVLTCGIPSWTREHIEDLSETDAERLGLAILALTPVSAEPDLGNAPAPSIGS